MVRRQVLEPHHERAGLLPRLHAGHIRSSFALALRDICIYMRTSNIIVVGYVYVYQVIYPLSVLHVCDFIMTCNV